MGLAALVKALPWEFPIPSGQVRTSASIKIALWAGCDDFAAFLFFITRRKMEHFFTLTVTKIVENMLAIIG